MENFDRSGFSVSGAKKKRSSVSRRPCPDPQQFSLRSPADCLDSGCNERNLNFLDAAVVSDGLESENKCKMLKLKVGGVTHTIHTKSPAEFQFNGGTAATKPSVRFNPPKTKQKPFLQENISGNHSFPSNYEQGLHDRQLKDSSSGEDYLSTEKIPEKFVSVNETFKCDPVRKSKRVPKRRVMDIEFNDGGGDDYEDKEIKYPGRTKYQSSSLSKDSRKMTRSERIHEDNDYMEEEEEPTSGDDPGYVRTNRRKGSSDYLIVGRMESTPITRNQALQSGKDNLSMPGASVIEFPNGLPPVPPRKHKDKLSKEEGQLKKFESAQRRKIQSEKAAREAEAEAIRRILGQESGRKKREEKIKKQRDELAQEKAAYGSVLTCNTVRLVMRPTGTIVTFSDDIGLPNIFNQGRSSYPPPREKCAGPNCTNVYKYRDSKSKLPLCSLRCYKAVH